MDVMKAVILFLFSFLFFIYPTKQFAAQYYKCTTDKGTIFSQQPCGSRATKHTINVTDPNIEAPKDFVKQLNELERQQIVRNLEAEIRSNKHKLAILDRERDRAQFQQEQRLSRILSDQDKKLIEKDIKQQLKSINKQYKQDVDVLTKKLARLEKKLKRYN